MKSCFNGQTLVDIKNNLNKVINEKSIKEKNAQCSKNFPNSRWKHASIVYQNHLYIMAGCSWIKVLRDLWCLDLKEFCKLVEDHILIHDSWKKFDYTNENLWCNLSPYVGDIPPLQSHTMVAYDNQLYIFGGTFVYDRRDCPLWIYSIEFQIMRKWKVTDNIDLPVPRRNHSCSIFKNTMLIFGGFGDVEGSIGDLWIFDLKLEIWHLIWSYKKANKKGPCPRHDHVAVIDNKNLWIFGGMNGIEECNDLWQWKIEYGQWTKINFKVGPVSLHYMSTIKIRHYWIIYGFTESKRKLEKWKFNFNLNKWISDYSTIINLPLHSTFCLSSNKNNKRLSINKYDHLNMHRNKVCPMSEKSWADTAASTDKLCMKSCSTFKSIKNDIRKIEYTCQKLTPVDITPDAFFYSNCNNRDHHETNFTEYIHDSNTIEMVDEKEYILLLGNNINNASFENYICVQYTLM